MNKQLGSTRDGQAGAQSSSAAPSLFSHPDVHHASTPSGVPQQGSYTNLFREPADGSPDVN
ncbi:hypothetical protein ADL03_21115 [Nocardia sp. NRRL S-836]|nr:hypothetical protein ADL03_21115 [Nocardia sp. NRRL S-836]